MSRLSVRIWMKPSVSDSLSSSWELTGGFIVSLTDSSPTISLEREKDEHKEVFTSLEKGKSTHLAATNLFSLNLVTHEPKKRRYRYMGLKVREEEE